MPADLKPSCHLITWGLAPGATEQGLKEAHDLGYRACETFTHIGLEYEDRLDDFRKLLDSHEMKLSALYAGATGGGNFGDPTKFEDCVAYNGRVAKLLAAMGADRIVFGPGRRPEGGPDADYLKQVAKTVNEAAKATLEHGVKACLHPHMYTEVQDRNEIDYVLENTDPNYVFFAPDTAHIHKAGFDPVAVMRDHADRIAYLHLKDVTPEDPDAESFPIIMEKADQALPIFCELGLGTVNLTGCVDFLREINYNGWITVEIDQSTSTPLNSMTICRDYVEKELGVQIQGRVV